MDGQSANADDAKTVGDSFVYRATMKMAEREGFEPSVGYKPTHAFQACALNHSAISPVVYLQAPLAKDAVCKPDSLCAIERLFLTNKSPGQVDSPLAQDNKLAVAKLRVGDLEQVLMVQRGQRAL